MMEKEIEKGADVCPTHGVGLKHTILMSIERV